MFKNVSLRPRVVSGRGTWRLVGPDGKEIAAFSAFAESIKSMATNSIASYARHVAQFLDYLIEVADVVGQGAPLTKLQLTEAVEAYGDYLLLGTDASNEIASSIARSIPPGVNSPASLVPKKAAVRRFLRMSEAVRKELQELARMGAASQMRVDEQPLLPELGQQRLLTPFEIRAMQANSMIAGVVAGGGRHAQRLRASPCCRLAKVWLHSCRRSQLAFGSGDAGGCRRDADSVRWHEHHVL